ncbi:hypothetical protein [Carp edema virus]|nr:hypothetical protein [Carp edema virus]
MDDFLKAYLTNTKNTPELEVEDQEAGAKSKKTSSSTKSKSVKNVSKQTTKSSSQSSTKKVVAKTKVEQPKKKVVKKKVAKRTDIVIPTNVQFPTNDKIKLFVPFSPVVYNAFYYPFEYLLNMNPNGTNYVGNYYDRLMDSDTISELKLFGFDIQEEGQRSNINVRRAEELLVRLFVKSKGLEKDLYFLKKIEIFETSDSTLCVYKWLLQTFNFGCTTVFEFSLLYKIILESLNPYDKNVIFLYYDMKLKKIYMLNLFWKYNLLFGCMNAFTIGPNNKLIHFLYENKNYFRNFIDSCYTEMNLISPGQLSQFYIHNGYFNDMKPSTYFV